jgi:hypothetical protein
MAKRKRIITPVAKRWAKNPLWELAKLRATELNITVREAQDLLVLEHELAQIKSDF